MNGYFADKKIAEAHAATVVAEDAVALERKANTELRNRLEPEITALEEEVSTLTAENAEKESQIVRERRAGGRAREEVRTLIQQQKDQEEIVASSANDQLVLRSLQLIEEGYPQIEDPNYRVFRGDDFVANRAAAEGFTLGLTEAVSSRLIVANQQESLESLEIIVTLTSEQKDNLTIALEKEQEARSLTNDLLVSERQLSELHLENISALNNEVDAYESKLKFDLFSPKCGAGGFAGISVTGEAAAGVGIFCGWIF